MAAIAGIWQLDGQKIELPTAEGFIGSLAHRGADSQGVLIEDDGRLALAHRRAALLDQSGCHQPIRSFSGRYLITYDGEIYNSSELRNTLEAKGFHFRSKADAELVLAAYEQWGADCLPRFNGVWSFAIWDCQRRSLFLTRDRFGVKPLYGLFGHLRCAFASELKAFLYLDGFQPVADRTTLMARLAGNFGDGVLLREIECAPPGHWIEVTSQGIRRQRWWNTIDHLCPVPGDFANQAEEFRELLFDACRLRACDDLPIATSLSGGLDSASVLCSIAAVERRQCPRPGLQSHTAHRAFVAGFRGTSQDETEHALLAAQHAGAIAVVRELSANDFRADLDDFLYQFEEIGGLFGAAPWNLYREMRRQGIAVSMEGHGADTILGGMATYVRLALARGRGFVAEPRRTLDLIDTLQHMHDPRQPDAPPNAALIAALTIPAVRSMARRISVWSRRQRGVVGALLQNGSASAGPKGAASEQECAIDALGPMSAVLYRSFHGGSLSRVLRNFDVHSMGHGVQARMPFLDWRVVTYAFSVPDESKVGSGYTKRLLREAMRGVLPEALRLRRHKVGYNAPVANWLAGGLADWLWDELNDQEFLRSELWDGHAIMSLARAKRETNAPWHPQEAHLALLAVTAHWWLTRWARRSPVSMSN